MHGFVGLSIVYTMQNMGHITYTTRLASQSQISTKLPSSSASICRKFKQHIL